MPYGWPGCCCGGGGGEEECGSPCGIAPSTLELTCSEGWTLTLARHETFGFWGVTYRGSRMVPLIGDKRIGTNCEPLQDIECAAHYSLYCQTVGSDVVRVFRAEHATMNASNRWFHTADPSPCSGAPGTGLFAYREGAISEALETMTCDPFEAAIALNFDFSGIGVQGVGQFVATYVIPPEPPAEEGTLIESFMHQGVLTFTIVE